MEDKLNKIHELPYEKEDLENAKYEFSQTSINVWDPGLSISNDNLVKNCSKIQAQYLYLEKNYSKAKKKIAYSKNVGKLGFVISFILMFYIGIGLAAFVLLICWTYYLSLSAMYKSLASSLIKLRIAKKQNWIYDPGDSIEAWENLRLQQPELFQMGIKEHKINEQFWGSTLFENKRYHFYMGNFYYTETKGSGKDKSDYVVTKHFMTVYMPNRIKARFLLSPQVNFAGMDNTNKQKEITTESNEFNSLYRFSYRGSKDDVSNEIFKILSPAVQEKLIKLAAIRLYPQVFFAENTITFMFGGRWDFQLKTDFKKSLEVYQEDIESMNKEINLLAEISNEIIKYID